MLIMKQTNSTEIASDYHDLKDRLHQKVIEMLDLDALSLMSQEAVTAQLNKLIEQLLQQESVPLNQRERARIVQDVVYEVVGLGPTCRRFSSKCNHPSACHRRALALHTQV